MIQIIIILLLSSIKITLFEQILTDRIGNGLICSGKRYDSKKYPYVVTVNIQPKGKSYSYLCTGTLIKELYVLTAAHCTFGIKTNEVKVYQGSSLNNKVSRKVVELHLHKDYNPEAEIPAGDICVMKLKSAFPNVKTYIEIGGEPKEFADHKALKCVSIGFGVKDNKSTDGAEGNMIETLVRHGRTDCKDPNTRLITTGWPQYLCSQPTTKDNLKMTCHGDSGGPMICNNKLYGVCSFMYKIDACGVPDIQNVHVFIHYFLKWVNGIISPEGNEKKDDEKKDDKKEDDEKEDDKKDDKKEEEKKKKKKKKKKKSSGNSIKPCYKFHRIVTILLYCVLIFIWN